jgi:hypothetical protein
MTARHRLLLFGLPTIAGLAVGVWLLWPRTAITRENAAKLHVGMTLEEVETILGGPARDESTGSCLLDVDSLKRENLDKFEILREALRSEIILDRPGRHWQSDSVIVRVKEGQEDQDWRIIEVEQVPVVRSRNEESVLDMLRRWLRL